MKIYIIEYIHLILLILSSVFMIYTGLNIPKSYRVKMCYRANPFSHFVKDARNTIGSIVLMVTLTFLHTLIIYALKHITNFNKIHYVYLTAMLIGTSGYVIVQSFIVANEIDDISLIELYKENFKKLFNITILYSTAVISVATLSMCYQGELFSDFSFESSLFGHLYQVFALTTVVLALVAHSFICRELNETSKIIVTLVSGKKHECDNVYESRSHYILVKKWCSIQEKRSFIEVSKSNVIAISTCTEYFISEDKMELFY